MGNVQSTKTDKNCIVYYQELYTVSMFNVKTCTCRWIMCTINAYT